MNRAVRSILDAFPGAQIVPRSASMLAPAEPTRARTLRCVVCEAPRRAVGVFCSYLCAGDWELMVRAVGRAA